MPPNPTVRTQSNGRKTPGKYHLVYHRWCTQVQRRKRATPSTEETFPGFFVGGLSQLMTGQGPQAQKRSPFVACTTQTDLSSPTPTWTGPSSPSPLLPWALVCPFPESLLAQVSVWLISLTFLGLNSTSSGKPSLASRLKNDTTPQTLLYTHIVCLLHYGVSPGQGILCLVPRTILGSKYLLNE